VHGLEKYKNVEKYALDQNWIQKTRKQLPDPILI